MKRMYRSCHTRPSGPEDPSLHSLPLHECASTSNQSVEAIATTEGKDKGLVLPNTESLLRLNVRDGLGPPWCHNMATWPACAGLEPPTSTRFGPLSDYARLCTPLQPLLGFSKLMRAALATARFAIQGTILPLQKTCCCRGKIFALLERDVSGLFQSCSSRCSWTSSSSMASHSPLPPTAISASPPVEARATAGGLSGTGKQEVDMPRR